MDDIGRSSPAIARQPSSSSCASSSGDSAPYLRVMKTQLNFFMTRLLFMQEDKADSLGARATNARRMNNSGSNMNNSGNLGSNSGNLGSNSSFNFNNSASRLDHVHGQGHGTNTHGAKNAHLLGAYMEEDDLGTDDFLCVFNDNARILPNRVAKSMPAPQFPPAAPESPRPVETREGIIMMTPTHHSIGGAAAGLPEALPLGVMTLEDKKNQDYEDDSEDQAPDLEEVYEEELMMDDSKDHNSATTPSRRDLDRKPRARSKSISSVPAIPTELRVFPKNKRRSRRTSGRSTIKRSQSDISDDGSNENNISTSLH
jgi:hypothetical protein